MGQAGSGVWSGGDCWLSKLTHLPAAAARQARVAAHDLSQHWQAVARSDSHPATLTRPRQDAPSLASRKASWLPGKHPLERLLSPLRNRIVEKAGRIEHPTGVLLTGPIPHLDPSTLEELQAIVGRHVEIRSTGAEPIISEVSMVDRSRSIGGELCVMIQLSPETKSEQLGSDGPWEIWSLAAD